MKNKKQKLPLSADPIGGLFDLDENQKAQTISSDAVISDFSPVTDKRSARARTQTQLSESFFDAHESPSSNETEEYVVHRSLFADDAPDTQSVRQARAKQKKQAKKAEHQHDHAKQSATRDKTGREKRAKKKKSRARRVVLCVVCVLLAALIAGGCWFFLFYRPDTGKREQTRDNVVQAVFGDANDAGEESEAPTIADASRKEGVYNFLAVGVDYLAGLSDVMMIVQFDTVNDTVYVAQVPRDTYYYNGSYASKLNSFYASAHARAVREGSEDPDKEALETLRSFFESAFGIPIDYYLCVDTAGFRDVIDAIGGVDMEVPRDMYYSDPAQGLYINLKAGMQHLDGEQAEQFVRYRKGYAEGDIGRLDAQKLFLAAVARQLQESMDIGTLVDVAQTTLQYMTTDLTIAQAAFFAKEAYGVHREDISFITMPGQATWSGSMSVYVLLKQNLVEVINNGLNPYQTALTEEQVDYYGYFTDTSDADVHGMYTSYIPSLSEASSASSLVDDTSSDE